MTARPDITFTVTITLDYSQQRRLAENSLESVLNNAEHVINHS